MNKSQPQNLRTFFIKYGANIAGPIWISGSVVQLLIGTVATSPREIISSVINILSPATFLLFGHKNQGVIAGAISGIIGTELAVHPGLAAGEFGTIFGFSVFVIASIAGIFGVPLTRKFNGSKNLLLRSTLGHPRRMMGLMIFALARMPIIYTGITHGRGLSYITPFIIWSFGDLALSLSRADRRIGNRELLL
jgi:hypothetical protein